MSKVRWFGLVLAALFLVSGAFAGPELVKAPNASDVGRAIANPNSIDELDEDTVEWSEDFESGLDSWTWVNALAQTDIYWAADDASANTGTYAWYCSDGEGGYGSHWLQWLMTPALDLSGTTAATVDFMFRLSCEGSDWDGAAVWVFYGPDEDNLTAEPLTPTGTTYNNVNPINGFTGEFFLAEGPGWSGDFLDWSAASASLADYASNAVVKVAFVFASDGNTEPGFGFMVDDISVDDGETNIFFDGAEDAVNSLMTMTAGNDVGPGAQVALGEPEGAPSPTHALGTTSTERGYYEYWESPLFDMPEAGEGETLWFNLQVNVEMENNDPRGVWRFEVWDPENNMWHYGSNIRGESGSNYIYVGGSGGWSDFTTDYGTDWIATSMAGVEDVRVRVGLLVEPGTAAEDFTFCWWDDVELIKSTLEHDVGFLATYVPFPRSVGQPISTTTYMANLGPNAETVPAFTWNYGAGIRPVYPLGPYSLAVDEAIILTLDAQLNDGFAGWVPTTAEDVTITFTHTLSPDDIPDNNGMEGDVTISPEGTFELGYDGSLLGTTSNMAYWGAGEGALVHIMPDAMAGGVPFVAQTLTAIKYQLPWSDGWYGAGATVQYDVSVLAGGPPPLSAIYTSDPIDFTDPSGTGAFGTYWITHELAEDDQITFEAGEDYYLYIRPLTVGGAEGSAFEHVPFIRAQSTTHVGENFASSYYTYDTDTYGYSSRAWAIRAITEADMESNGAPTEFTLDFPGEVVQFPDVGFIWEASMDPEHGPVNYQLTIMSGEDEVVFDNIMDNAMAVNLADTDLGAEPNQEYSWYVTAYDVWGAETQSTDTFEFVMADLAPTEFALTGPSDEGEWSELDVDFEWEESHSPQSSEGVTVSYTLVVERGATSYSVEDIDTESATVNLETAGFDPAYLQEYTWYVIATDSEGRERMSDAEFGFTFTGLSVEEDALPTEFAVSELYPNPFNPSTSMSVALPNAAPVHVTVFDVLGRQVADLNYGQLAAGRHHLTWGDNTVSSGLYVFVIKAGPMQVTRKAVFMK